jgi:hypothetical protein
MIINPKIVLDGLELGIDGYLVEQQTTRSSTSLKFLKNKNLQFQGWVKSFKTLNSPIRWF